MRPLQARPGAVSYGHDIGVLMIDCFNPFIPGDVGNARTYDFPVLFHQVPEVTIQRLVKEGDLALTPHIVAAARYLQRQGVHAITSDCGYMLHFQDAVRQAVDIPVMLSSLLQLPLMSALLPPAQAIGVVCADSGSLSAGMLQLAFPTQDRRVVVAGMQACPAFRHAILDEAGSIDPTRIEHELVAVGRALMAQDPTIGAILLECSNLPPYARALQEALK